MKIDIDSEPRVKACDALMFVNSCNEQDIAIIGIEGGRIFDGKFIPDIDLIADLSRKYNIGWHEFCNRCNKGATYFLKEIDLSSDVVFVMTIIDEQGFNELYMGSSQN